MSVLSAEERYEGLKNALERLIVFWSVVERFETRQSTF